MGTLGGKIGFIAGVVIASMASVSVIHLIVGSCFFEGGCGSNETTRLVAAAIVCVFIGIGGGLLVRVAVNALSRATR